MTAGRVGRAILGMGIAVGILAASAVPGLAATGQDLTLTSSSAQKTTAVGQTVTFTFTATSHAAGLRNLDLDLWHWTNVYDVNVACSRSDGATLGPDGGNCEWGGLQPGLTYTATVTATVSGGRSAGVLECLYNYAVAHRAMCKAASATIA